jgi:alcohol dehydrogenase YqhD (iron-dependent ADH family)
MNKFKYYAPTEVIFGKDVENQVGKELLKSEATKVLIHYGGESAIKSGLLDRVTKSIWIL